VILNVDVTQTRESADGVELRASDGRGFEFDQVVFCTGPLSLLPSLVGWDGKWMIVNCRK